LVTRSKKDYQVRVNTFFCPKGVNLPYVVQVEYPKAKIGIFGDSFAQLAEFNNNSDAFTHESSWIYFLANILSMECHTYGISGAGMGDIFHTILECDIEYDYYIIFHTIPKRRNIFSNIKFSAKNSKTIKNKFNDRKALVAYWDESHNIFDFGKPILYCKHHLTNKNIPEENEFDTPINPLDQNGGHHHMSSRGNLLFAIELSKLMFATSLKN
jgi:hypothetical protein